MTLEYLRQTWFFFRSNLSMILRIQLPFLLIISAISYYAVDALNPDNIESQRKFLIVLVLTNFTLIPVYWGATISYFDSIVKGTPYSLGQALGQSLSRWRHLFLVYLLTSIAASFGFMLFIIPGIYLLIRFSFADYFCITENMGPIESLKASWETTDKYFWQLLTGLALIFVMISAGEILINRLLLSDDSENMPLSMVIDLTFGIFHSLLTLYGFRIYCVMKEEDPGVIARLKEK